MSSTRRVVSTPERLSDIEVNRVFEVYCPTCGIIDAPRSYATAVESRHDHWRTAHVGGAEG